MNAGHKRMLLGAPVLALLLGLAGCGDHRGGVENTQMPMVERPNVEIARQGMDGARDITREDTERRDAAVLGAGPQEDGVATDARIVGEVRQALQADAVLAGTQVDVSSQRGEVVLHGRAPDAAARDRATRIARDVRDVKAVDNLMTVG